jgi:hypothetical protein
MVDYSTLSIVFTGLSISIAAFYYINTLRYTRRSQKHAEDTRKVQLLMQIHQSQDEAYQHRRAEVANLDFKDLDDFEENTTRDQFVKWAAMISQWNILGLMLKMGYFDTEMLFEYLHARGPIVHWEKFKPIIEGYREHHKYYSFAGGMEYLAEEMKRYRDEQEQKLI